MNFVPLDLSSRDDLNSLSGLASAVPGDWQRVYGSSNNSDLQMMINQLPPGKTLRDKFVFGLYDDSKLVACLDLIRGYPYPHIAFLGLLIVDESSQRQRLGSMIVNRAEEIAARWSGVKRMRLAVAVTNSDVLAFWEKMGFSHTGERSYSREGAVAIECLIIDKEIQLTRSRYSMRCQLNHVLPVASSHARCIQHSDAPALGRLMVESYRGTIEDEGENLSQYTTEMQDTLSGVWGRYLPEASFCLEIDGRITAATMITLWKERPLLAQCMTSPHHQSRGIATALIYKSMNALVAEGWEELTLGVTRGNHNAERLYRRLGFVEI